MMGDDDVSETESYHNYSEDSNDSSGWSDSDSISESIRHLRHHKRHDKYWNKLGHGILSHPAPLQVQCLLFIVGNLDEFSSTALGLLPAHLRHKLLLILPVVDVCKLEGTPLTDGILMDDIWESLYHARMPNEESELGSLIMKPKLFSELYSYGRIICNWKEAYFRNFLSIIEHYPIREHLTRNDHDSAVHCFCMHYHFVSDMLYGVYRNDGVSLDAYCFNDSSSQSVHNVYRYAEECPRFTRCVYLDKVDTIYMSADSTHYIHSLIELFSNVPAPFKMFNVDCAARLWNQCWDLSHLPSTSSCEHINLPFSCFFSSLEALSLEGSDFYTQADHLDSQQILNLVVHSIFTSQCKLNAIFLYNDTFNMVYPYLVKADCSSLKILHLHRVTIFRSVCEILHRHNELQSLHISTGSKIYGPARDIQDLIQSIICLMQRPLLRDLCFYYRNLDPIQFQLIDILRQFFSSPYSITLQIVDARFEDRFITDEPPFEVTNMSSKSLVIVTSSFPQSICNLLPSDMHFGNLELCRVSSWKRLVKFDSISVDGIFKMSLDEEDDLRDISSLFRIATATEWKILNVYLSSQKALESFTNALLIIKGKISHLVLRDSGDIFHHCPDVLSLLEVIFKQVDSSLPPYFKLEIGADLKKDILQSIHDVWKKCGAVQLKKMTLSSVQDVADGMMLLSKMAVKCKLYL